MRVLPVPRIATRRARLALLTGTVALLASGGAAAPVAGLTPPHQQHVAVPPRPVLADHAVGPPVVQHPVPAHAADLPVDNTRQAPATGAVIDGLAANGIPNVALNAYRVAAKRMAAVDPSCGIDWALLAGIGREESDHGRFGGAALHPDGTSTPKIIGPALDGTNSAYIPAPANGMALDGDARYAHALGPMQFIPSTWAIYGTDADGDGRANIFDINDAALSAARYLCAAGGDLATHAGRARAVFAYNHLDTYVAQVLALADAYRRGIAITGIPVGITSGALPPVSNTGVQPPANPGPPTAVGGEAATSGAPTSHATKAPAKHPTTRRAQTPATAPTPHAPVSRHTGTDQGTTPAASGSTTSRATAPSSPEPSRTPTPSASPTPTQSPTPSPTPTTKRICLVWDLFVKGRCDVWL